MRLISQGDINAFEECYRKYSPMVRRYLASLNSHHDLEDIVQEAFTRFCQQRKQFRGCVAIETYLIGIAKNILRERNDLLNPNSYPDFRFLDVVDPASEKATKAENELQYQDIVQLIDEAKSQLPPSQGQALELVYFRGLSITQAAKIAGCNEGSFRNRLYQAREKLEKRLQPWVS